MMGYEVIVPLLHDPQNNSTRIASIAPPKPHAPREAIMRNIEQVLKTALQEFQACRCWQEGGEGGGRNELVLVVHNLAIVDSCY